jgi:chemotaxis protein MotB
MAKNKCPDCETCLPAWLAAFGDLMSLLLCFFVLLLSMSSMDAKKVDEAIGSLSGAMSVLDGGIAAEPSKRLHREAKAIVTTSKVSQQLRSVSEVIIDANEMIKKGKGPSITLEEAQNGFVIELPAALLFKAGSAVIENEDALLFLKRIALIANELSNDMRMSVQGHTDNLKPGANSPFKDNWELSSARSISVLQELLLDGVDPKRISAAGFAEFTPKATNATKAGRAKNRRVELHFYGTKPENEEKFTQSILDKAAAQ